MVEVAKDQPPIGGELPSEPGLERVAGVPLTAVLALPAARGAKVHATPEQLLRQVVRASRLSDVGDPAHHLVCAPAAVDGEAPAGDPVASLAGRGATGLVVAGPCGDWLERWRDSAREAGLPLIVLPARASADDLLTEVLGAVLDHQSSILARVEQAHQTLVDVVLAGGSLEDVCRGLAGFLGGAAMVTTTDGRVLASAGAPEELRRARDLDCFDRTGRLITEEEHVGLRPPHSAASHRCLVPVVAGQLGLGLLVAFCSDRELSAVDAHLLDRAATVAALAITKEQAVSAVESKYRAEFLRDALSGRAGTPSEAAAHAAALGWDIDRRMVVVVAETDEDDAHSTRAPEEVSSLQNRFARAWVQAVAVRDERAPVVGFSQEVVTLLGVSEDADTEAIMRSVGDVVRVVRGDGGGGRRTFTTGVSRPVTSGADLPRAYEEALNAVTVGRQVHGHSALTHFDGLGIFRLLALVPDSADLRRFARESLGELAGDDSPELADLRQTLSVLLDTNMNVAETARILFFHYNTLRYRIAKLERMLGPFTSDPDLRLTLALALKVHQMRGI